MSPRASISCITHNLCWVRPIRNQPSHTTRRVATFALGSQSVTGVRGYNPRKIFGIPYAIWCVLRHMVILWLECNATLRHKHIYRGLQRSNSVKTYYYFYNFYLRCSEFTLKSGTFGVPRMVLPGRGTARHKAGTSREIRGGWQPIPSRHLPITFTSLKYRLLLGDSVRAACTRL